MNQLDAERGWLRLAGRSARKVNFGWWVQSWAPIVVFAALLGFTIVFYLRSRGWAFDQQAATYGIIAGVVIAGIIAVLAARRHFHSRESALVRLEARHGLNNALTTAREGLGPWPEVPGKLADGLKWRPLWLLAPPLLATGLLLAAFYIPVTPVESNNTVAPPEPGAWNRMENQIKQLKKVALADDQDLERIGDQIQQLRSTPQENWFGAASLEATQGLEGAFNQGLKKMSNDMRRADHNIGSLAKFGDQMSARAKARAAEDFKAAAESLQSGKLKPNEALRDALKGIDPNRLGDLPPEKLQALREQLQKNADALRRVAGRAGEQEGEWEKGEGQGQPGEGQPGGEGEGEEGGNGGLNEGPGHSPLQLGDGTDLGTNNLEGLSSNDLKRAMAGDLLDEIAGGHEIDKTKTGPRAGGGIQSTGQGGDTVTRDQLLPSEKAVLRNYFD